MSFEDAALYMRQKVSAGSTEQQLFVYGLYKQATMGDAPAITVGIASMRARTKRSAWEKNRGMARENAQEKYIQIADRLRGYLSGAEEAHAPLSAGM